MFTALGRFTYRRRWLVLLLGIIFMVASGIYGTSVFGKLKGGGFYDPNAESTKLMDAIPEKLGRDPNSIIALYTSTNGATVTGPAYRAAVLKTLDRVKGQKGVGNITSFYSTGAKVLVSNDNKSTYAVIGLTTHDNAENKATLDTIRPLLKDSSLQVRLGGEPAINEEINDAVSKDLETAEMMTFPVLALLLVIIFGSLVAAALPLAIGGMVILGAFLIIRLATDFTDVSIFSINVITMLGLGLAIDYSLFIVSRFREELARRNGDVPGALAKTMQTAGRTVVFSGFTVAASLLSLQVFPQMFLKSMGLGGAAAVLVAMLAAITILPAILALLGTRVNALSLWPLFRRGKTQEPLGTVHSYGFWYNMSRFVMQRPTLVLIVALIPLIVVGIPFLHVKLSIADARALPAGRESRVVSEVLTSSFPQNETTPIQSLVHTDKAALDAASIGALYDYTRAIARIDGVTRVDSLVNIDPRMDKATYQAFYSEQALKANPPAARAASQFSKGDFSLVSVLYKGDWNSQASMDLVKAIRNVNPPQGMAAQVGGAPAIVIDFLGSLGRGMPLAIGLIIAVVFVILFFMLGSVVVPLKAVVLNILSLSVSFGAIVWIFQDGHLSNLLGFEALGSIDGTNPVLIFAIAFGLSMDYEVFLLSRIKENYDRTGDTTSSVALGVQKTGAIITSAAALLVLVFLGFATGQVVFVKLIGIGMSLAVLVDATLVRMLLVPATMRLMGKYNWWAPRPLKALYNRLGLSEVEHDEEPDAHPAPLLPREQPQTSVGIGA
ncbi:MAG: MMPL family transporter [Chloroflexota bacterium]|nr:MMPL family transporter [Chloroflexota bacterium]